MKQYECNKRLSVIWKIKNNEYMINKLSKIKPIIDTKTPESLYFYKTIFNKRKNRELYLKQQEILHNNNILLQKLENIYNTNLREKIMKKSSSFEIKRNYISAKKKFEIIKVAQENQHMLKRLKEKCSIYSVAKWEQDYLKSQYYKKNKCLFPSLNYTKLQTTKFNNMLNNNSYYYKPRENKSFSFEKKLNLSQKSLSINKNIINNNKNNNSNNNSVNYSLNNNNNLQKYLIKTKNNNEENNLNNKESNNNDQKILYKTETILGNLEHCNIEFIIQKDNFTIKIESKDLKNKNYVIIFNTIESIKQIQNIYKKYDEMIADMEYNEKEDVVKINNIKNINLECKYLKLDANNNNNNIVDNSNKEKKNNNRNKNNNKLILNKSNNKFDKKIEERSDDVLIKEELIKNEDFKNNKEIQNNLNLVTDSNKNDNSNIENENHEESIKEDTNLNNNDNDNNNNNINININNKEVIYLNTEEIEEDLKNNQ